METGNSKATSSMMSKASCWRLYCSRFSVVSVVGFEQVNACWRGVLFTLFDSS